MVAVSVLEGGVAESRGTAMWQRFVARQGRSAALEEVGDVAVLLCTPQMSLVNGQNLFIDGYVLENHQVSMDCFPQPLTVVPQGVHYQ